MLQLDLKQSLKNLAGEPLKDGEGNEVAIGKVMANAIIGVQNPEDPTRNYLISTDLYQKDVYEFTAESLEYIKKQLKQSGQGGGSIFPTLYKGQILEILNKLDKPNEQEEETKQD